MNDKPEPLGDTDRQRTALARHMSRSAIENDGRGSRPDRYDDELPLALPSWSWRGIALICAFGAAMIYLIYRLAEMIVRYAFPEPLL